MSEKYMLHLFDIFRQERQDYISKFDGNGLALVKKDCDLNNIRINIKSILKQDADITFAYPVRIIYEDK